MGKLGQLFQSIFTAIVLSIVSIVGCTVLGFVIAVWLFYRAVKYPFCGE